MLRPCSPLTERRYGAGEQVHIVVYNFTISLATLAMIIFAVVVICIIVFQALKRD